MLERLQKGARALRFLDDEVADPVNAAAHRHRDRRVGSVRGERRRDEIERPGAHAGRRTSSPSSPSIATSAISGRPTSAVGIVAVEPLDERDAQAVDLRAPGAVIGPVGAEVGLDRFLGERAELHAAGHEARALLTACAVLHRDRRQERDCPTAHRA